MEKTINNTPQIKAASNATAGVYSKPVFTSVNLWNIHNMVRSRVSRRYF